VLDEWILLETKDANTYIPRELLQFVALPYQVMALSVTVPTTIIFPEMSSMTL